MMMSMSSRVWAVALLMAMLLVPVGASAKGGGARGGSHGGGSSYRAKTVQVRTYKKKNGTVVQHYKRRPPR